MPGYRPEEYLAEIRDFLREAVDKLIALGCDYIQLDAPNYGSYCDPGTRERMASSYRRALPRLQGQSPLRNYGGDEARYRAVKRARTPGPSPLLSARRRAGIPDVLPRRRFLGW